MMTSKRCRLRHLQKNFVFCVEFVHRMHRHSPNKSIEMMLTQWRITTMYIGAVWTVWFVHFHLASPSPLRFYSHIQNASVEFTCAMQRKENENDCTRMWIEASGKLHAINSHVPKRPRGKYANKLLRDSAATQFRFDAIALYSSIHFPLLLCCFAIEMRLNESHVSGAGPMCVSVWVAKDAKIFLQNQRGWRYSHIECTRHFIGLSDTQTTTFPKKIRFVGMFIYARHYWMFNVRDQCTHTLGYHIKTKKKKEKNW